MIMHEHELARDSSMKRSRGRGVPSAVPAVWPRRGL